MTINDLVSEAYTTAKEKGWWDYSRQALEIHALIHSEISEATSAVRDKNETHELEELADAIIRIADYCGYKKWNLENALIRKMSYNKKRSYRHGGKFK